MVGFNILVVSVTLIVWYYFTEFDLNLIMAPSPMGTVHVIDENDLAKLPWIKDIPTNVEKSEKYCRSEHGCYCIDQDCPNFPRIHIYQLNSVVETLQLTKVNTEPVAPINIYNGWIEYNGKYYGISFRVPEYDRNYIAYGLIACIVGTLAIALVWAKFRPR